ncbi:MAG: carboxylating nicotinate-nucleotide diphosphorylase [Lachnospiraceae bacterium]|nr:carboxylating nicotinate-nucleotide diphosphorylase [Lachnospiraceae bacterium]
MNNITLKLNADDLILSALREDIPSEDVTTNSVMKDYEEGTCDLIAKEDGILCGTEVFKRVFILLDENTEVVFSDGIHDGSAVKKGDLLARLKGDIRVLLSGERTALNFLQRMSGISTYTRRVVDALDDPSIQVLDTRKTTPNMRIFEKYAVRVGGGHNHRNDLSDGVLLKDNHIGAAGGVKEAILAAKAYAPFVRKIEVETETIDMVKEAISAGADIIMLDNMSLDEMKEAIALIDGKAEVELSGNFTLDNIERIRGIGADYVSCGALTHSAPILDLSLKHLKKTGD